MLKLKSLSFATKATKAIASFKEANVISSRFFQNSKPIRQEWKGIKYDPNTTMWKHQGKVPRLPLPSLKETCDRYLEIVEPLVSQAQFQQTKHYVKEFVEGEEGKKLQEELTNLNKQSPTSYLEGFWDTMYLELRDPVIINVNPYVVLNDDPKRKTQPERAANLIYGHLKFLQQIKNNAIEPDMEKDDPYDMSQYLKVFGTSRIPQWRRDYLVNFMNESKHILVMSRNQFFTLDVIRSDGNFVPEEEIQANFQHIISQSTDSSGNDAPIGVFTAEERNRWAAIRGDLTRDSTNKASVDKIDRALFVVVLDDIAPNNMLETSKAMLHRDGTNRWYDKLDLVVFKNSQAGVVFEHSPFDGHSLLRTLTEVMQHNKAAPVKSGAKNVGSVSKLKWNVDETIRKHLETSKKNVSELIGGLESSVLIYNTYGKKYITSKKLSPDAFVQMAFQLAYYKLNGKTESTYESANTKKFLSGRTETLRSVTKESVQFTKTWSDPKAAKEQKIGSLKVATEAHIKRALLAKNGLGVDRHLFALRNLAYQKQQRLPRYTVPSLFQDPTYSSMCSNVLSTSNVSAPIFDLFGFGPVISNGLGLAYNIHNDTLRFNVTSWIGEAKKFTDKLEESLNDIKKTLD